jgi:colicin import membrane protein
VLAALAGCAAVRPPQLVASVPQSQSVAEADRKLALVARERAQAEAEFSASEQLCYAKFLVNNCLDGAREKRRISLAKLRAIEIEADHFKRKAAVDERDRALAKAEQDLEAERARIAAAPPPAPRAVPEAAAPKPAPMAHGRAAAQAAKMKKLEAQDKAGAAKRAANVAAFEKRKRESEQRQREIAEKKKAAASKDEAK